MDISAAKSWRRQMHRFGQLGLDLSTGTACQDGQWRPPVEWLLGVYRQQFHFPEWVLRLHRSPLPPTNALVGEGQLTHHTGKASEIASSCDWNRPR